MEFLKDTDRYYSTRCNISNLIHDSEHGCSIVLIDNKKYHMYKKLPVDVSVNGDTPLKLKCFNTQEYDVSFHRDGSINLVMEIEFEHVHFYDYVKESAENFRNGFNYIMETYNDHIQEDIPEKYELSVQSLFDVLIKKQNFNKDLNQIVFMRPVLCDDKDTFYKNLREIFFLLLHNFNRHNEAKIITSSKDTGTCSVDHFSRRSAAPELRCSYNSYDSCVHRLQHRDINGNLLKSRPPVLCNYILEEFNTTYTDEANSILGFRCRFSMPNNPREVAPKSSLYAYELIYKRKSTIHRMCIPSGLLGDEWYKWFCTEVLNNK